MLSDMLSDMLTNMMTDVTADNHDDWYIDYWHDDWYDIISLNNMHEFNDPTKLLTDWRHASMVSDWFTVFLN